jgi:hypothetical protein
MAISSKINIDVDTAAFFGGRTKPALPGIFARLFGTSSGRERRAEINKDRDPPRRAAVLLVS